MPKSPPTFNGPDPKTSTYSYKNPDALEPEDAYVAEVVIDGQPVNRLGSTRDEAWRKLAQYLIWLIESED